MSKVFEFKFSELNYNEEVFKFDSDGKYLVICSMNNIIVLPLSGNSKKILLDTKNYVKY